jgi:hypothetical protein
MDYHKVVWLQCLMLQHEEADFPLDAFCLTLCIKTVDALDLHGYAQAHDEKPSLMVIVN